MTNHRAAGPWALVCAMAMLLGAGFVQGQPVPDTILLPDSLGPLRPGYHLAFGSSTNNIYVASESSDIIVVDGNTFQRIKRINTGTPVVGALLVSQHNKLYCSYPSEGRIGVIDCASNSVVRLIQVGTQPAALCYSTGSDKLYCGDSLDSTVTVIDCAADTVVRVIEVGDSLTAITYDPAEDKVYAGTASALVAIGCSTDSVLARIDEVKAAAGLYVNQRRHKLYTVGPYGDFDDTMFVISTIADTVVARMGPYNLLPGLACDEAADRLYGISNWGGDEWDIVEFDCSGDTLTRGYYLSEYAGRAIVYDTLRNRLYYLGDLQDYGVVFGLDCATWDIVSTTHTEDCPAVLELDQVRRRLLYANWWDQENVLSVYDCTDDSLERRAVPLQGWQCTALCHNPVAGKLYYLWGFAAGGIGVVDEQTNRVTTLAPLPYGCGSTLAFSRTSNKLYCGAKPGLAILDGASDSLLSLADLGGAALYTYWFPDSNKLYCFVHAGLRYYIAVLDCYTDSVVREIEVYSGACRFEPLTKGLMVCDHGDGLMLIDCRTDSVLKDTAIPGNMYDISHSSASGGKFYMIHHYTYDRLEALSADSLSLLATVDWPYSGTQNLPTLACSDSNRKLYWFAGDSILVIDTRGDTVLKRMKAPVPLAAGCFDHTGRYAFCFAWDSIAVYDTQSDSLLAVYPTLPYPASIVPDPELGRIFVGCLDAILVFPDTPVSAVAEGSTLVLKRAPQTVVRDVLCLPEATGRKPQTASLMDISGRKVLDLHPGANDVRSLAPGVYFLRGPKTEDERPGPAVRKVVVTR